MAPLRVHAQNPRYFADEHGGPVYLTGSHTWNNLQDLGVPFDFTEYLDRLVALGHNFTRLWIFEQAKGLQWAQHRKDAQVSPCIFRRTGPGLANDGMPRFDLTQFDETFFERQHARVAAAAKRGVYVSVMLFMGFSVDHIDENGVPWKYHPFHRDNNVNGIDGDPDNRGTGLSTHTLELTAVTRLQEAYVRRVVEALNEFDNLLFEVSNESPPASTDWQYHVLRFIRHVEAGLPKQHPLGMTFQYRGGSNRTLLESPADWVSPNAEDGWAEEPPAQYAGKIILNDTDHLWGIGGTPSWVWKTFCRGHHPIFMDPWDDQLVTAADNPCNAIDPAPLRSAMGATSRIAAELNLARTIPRPELSSTRFCLADPGEEYLVFQPEDGRFTLRVVPRSYQIRWIDPSSGAVLDNSIRPLVRTRCRLTSAKPGPAVLVATKA
jgi:hypothetical protein